MNTINIGYTHWFEKNDYSSDTNPALNDSWTGLVNYDLEKLDTWKTTTSNYTKCPAFVNYVDQIWVLKSAIDVTITWDDAKKKITSNLFPASHDMLIKSHAGDFNPYTSPPIVAINNGIVFVADTDVWMDFLPPFNHIDPNWRLIPGSFNIHNWQRPAVPTFEMLGNTVKIQRGQPLAYFRFRSNNPQDKFKLIKQERTEELEKLVLSCSSLKFFQRNLSWKFVTGLITNKLRPKKLVKK